MTSSSSPLREEIRRLERLREEAPGSLAFVRLAEAYRGAGEHELALRVLEEGGADAPDHPAIHLVAARVHHDLGRREDERSALQRALEMDPENQVARKAMERLTDPADESSAGKAGPTAGAGRRASHSPEEREELLEQLGGVAGDNWWEEGRSDDDTGAPGTPPDDEQGPVTETMGRLYARQGLWDDAEAVYRRLLEERPEDSRLSQCLDSVRSREVPPRPHGRASQSPRRTNVGDGGASDRGGGESTVDREPETGGGAPTMRGHLRALLRGGGARPVRRNSGSESAPSVADRVDPGAGAGETDRSEEAGEDGAEGEMEELLRRWQRAARRGREE